MYVTIHREVWSMVTLTHSVYGKYHSYSLNDTCKLFYRSTFVHLHLTSLCMICKYIVLSFMCNSVGSFTSLVSSNWTILHRELIPISWFVCPSAFNFSGINIAFHSANKFKFVYMWLCNKESVAQNHGFLCFVHVL